MAALCSFNPRPPTGSDELGAPVHGAGRCFNPRPPTGSDYRDRATWLHDDWFQSTPPHGERRPSRSKKIGSWVVSIHAPPRGATRLQMANTAIAAFQSTPPHGERPQNCTTPAATTPVSIHAPPRGATFDVGGESNLCLGFNPRPPTGSDGVEAGTKRVIGVSIHAPPRGATRAHVVADNARLVSIHAPPRGATENKTF